ncbi:uncharacterized protein LOC131954398 [Physella acuta]|uniref:uncharacterized protein LOC131954398 n=1 Tax=Physella acuta TaxID=109671 RepID=UPI0027DC2424|nr:uncharacterized protein LOC131954398 [Physella acuta]
MFIQAAATLLVFVAVTLVQGQQGNPGPNFPSGPGGQGGQGFQSGSGGQLTSGGQFQCPNNEMRNYEHSSDCTQFWQCDGGVPTLSSCPPQLIFEPRNGTCAFPWQVQNPRCRPGGMCANSPPGLNPSFAYAVAHERFCNAFFMCSLNYLFEQCVFCGEGMYFNEGAGGCRDARGANLEVVCRGKEIVEHRRKAEISNDPICKLNAVPSSSFPTSRPQTFTTRPFNGRK